MWLEGMISVAFNILLHKRRLNPFPSYGLFFHDSLDRLFPTAGCLVSFQYYRFIKQEPVFNANSEDRD